jgi:hypothetical protein
MSPSAAGAETPRSIVDSRSVENAGRVNVPAQMLELLPLPALRLHYRPAEQVQRTNLAGEGVLAIHAHAPGNGAPLGLKVIAENARFAAHPCGAVSGFDAAASRELGERCAGIGVSSVEQLKEELWIG